MSVEINLLSSDVIIKKIGIEEGGELHKVFTETCAKAMDEFVPFRKGNLADYHIEGADTIVYSQPYATYQYFGERRDGSHKINPDNRYKGKHPLATSYWDQEMVTSKGADVTKAVQDAYDRGKR